MLLFGPRGAVVAFAIPSFVCMLCFSGRAWVATELDARRNRLCISLESAALWNAGFTGCCACRFHARRLCS